jgi:hypothetical protein
MNKIVLTLLAVLFSFVSFAALPPITGTASICEGSTTTLSNATPGGTWSSGTVSIATIGSATGVVAGIAAGTTNITYTDGVSSVYAVVTVNAVPAAITGSSVVCLGGSATLANVTPGGIWVSSNPAIATISFSTGVVTGVSLGTASISYTVSSGCSAMRVITVNPIPVVTLASSVVCVGTTTTFTASPLGGVWSMLPTGIASVAGAGITGLAVGTTVLNYTAGGCATTRSLTVNAAIGSITGPSTVCVGSAITLSNPTSGGTWSSANPAVANISSSTGILTGNSVGTTTVSYNVTGCIATTVITVNGAPTGITGPASVCVGSVITLTGFGAVSATWSSGTTSVATVGTSGNVTGVAAGTSVITYNTGCGSTTRIVSVNSSCAGTPVPGAASVSASVVCSGTALVLSLPAYTPVCGHAIQWQYSPDGLSWTNLPGATTAPFTYMPTSAYYYRCGITCVAGGTSAFSGPVYVTVDFSIAAHSIISAPDTACSATHFYIAACGVSPSFSAVTFFGDGDSTLTALSTTTLSDAHIYHNYTLPGTYSVTQIMYNGATAVDTVTFSYVYNYCRTLPIRFYHDNNSNCIYDGADQLNVAAVSVRIDSNGVPVDTITATTGFFYKAYGAPGTVYAFRPYSVSGGLIVACPATTVIYDTIVSYTNTYQVKYFGVRCGAPTSGFDLKVNATTATGRHTQRFDIIVSNFYCSATSPVVTLTFSPKYGYFPGTFPCYMTTPLPTSVAGNTMTWNLSALSANATKTITVWLERPSSIGPWLIPGDTVHSEISVSPTVGDFDISNNVITKVDTVRSSFDPNDIVVAPEGNILPCTQLQYKVRFQNTGNDTASNIYVLDTLSSELDPSSLQAVIASHPMNIAVINDGVRNIAKFEFPNINLPDSSHHNLCSGTFIFNIKARSTLPDGVEVRNRVGIYFDENPVVMTNEVINTGGIPAITGPANACIGYPSQYYNLMPSGYWASSTPAVGSIGTAGIVSGLTAGTTTVSYTVTNSCTSRTATKIVTVNPVVVPTVSIASAAGDTVCSGTSVAYTAAATFAGTAPVYTWKVNGLSVGSGGAYTYFPVAGDTVSVSLASSQACAMPATVADTIPMTVISMAMPVASLGVAPDDTACAGTPVSFTATPSYGGAAPAYMWYVNSVMAGSGALYVYTPANGDVVYCRMISNFRCRLADTVSSSNVLMTVDPLYIPVVSISAAPGLSAPAGDPITLTASVINAGPSPLYQWVVNGFIIPGATNNTYTSSTFADYDSVTCSVTGSGVCNITTYNSVYITITPAGVNDVTSGFDVHLFPNPNKGGFRIKGTIGTMNGLPVEMVITNTLGQVVFTGNSTTADNGSVNEDVQLPVSLANGVYILSLRSGEENKMFRFVIDK